MRTEARAAGVAMERGLGGYAGIRISARPNPGGRADLDGGNGLQEALLAAGPHAGEALEQAPVALRPPSA